MTINRPIPFSPIDLVELVALILGVLCSTIVWGPVGLLPLGFLWELILNPLTVYRMRWFRMLAVILMTSTGVGLLPAMVWVGAHAIRVLPQVNRKDRVRTYVSRYTRDVDPEPFRIHPVTLLGLPNPFSTIEVEGEFLVFSSPFGREYTRLDALLEIDFQRVGSGGVLRRAFTWVKNLMRGSATLDPLRRAQAHVLREERGVIHNVPCPGLVVPTLHEFARRAAN